MKEFNCDLHFHSPYSGGVSKKMLISTIAEQSRLKGLNLLGTADILHKEWILHAKETLEESNGVFLSKQHSMPFILQTEVQCIDSVHHILFFPDFNSVQEAKQKLKPYSNDMDSFGGGRPRIRLNAEKIAEIVLDAGGMIGAAHAFTPYFGIYAHFNSIRDCYGAQAKNIHFIELGLSADTDLADLMKENHSLSFLTNSDAHSPWPYRIGREFTRINLRKPDFNSLKKALERKNDALVTLNAGLDPREGKYHCSACSNCYAKLSLKEAETGKWKCPECGRSVKKGVKDRILELADSGEGEHPGFRPKYLHLLPLAEIIQLSLGAKNVFGVKVQEQWKRFVERFGNEINVLADTPIEELREVEKGTAEKISAFRNDWVLFIPGGGGNYGKPVLCDSKQEFERKKIELGKQLECREPCTGQKTLKEF